MSATIRVTADAAVNKQTRVKLLIGGAVAEYAVLEPGQSRDFVVYDNRTIEIREHVKGELE